MPKLEVWPQWASALKPRMMDKDGELQAYFAGWVQLNVAWVWAGNFPPTAWSKAEHEDLRRRLLEGARRTSLNEIKLASWWDYLVAAGNRLKDWKVALLPPVMHIPAPVPDFVRNDFMLLSDFRKVEGKFHALLKSGNAADHTYSLFVCSVVIFGGVTSVPLLDAILRTSMRRVHFHAGDVFVALEISLGQGELDFGTWFPDRLTTALMLRWLTSAKERSKAQSVAPASAITADKTTDGTTQRQRVSQAVQEAFSLLNLPSMPWQDFLHAAHVATALQVSPFLAHYLHGTFVSRSMHPTVYQRLNGWVADHAYQIRNRAKLQEFAPDPSLSDECLQAAPLPFDPLKSPENQLRFIRDITSILGTTVHSDVAKKLLNQRIVKSQGSLWPITEMLAKWASWRLGRPDDIGQVKPHTKRLAPSSALRYLNAIGRHLITEVGPEDVTDLDAEDFETAYEEAGSHVTTLKERAVYWMCVTAFHRYLTFCGAPHIDMEELDGYEGASVGSVAANVVSEREFQYFKREVWDTGTPEPDSPRLLWLLIAVLGFRCGLRRREIQMLGMHDFHPGEFPVLIVRASRLATLKSKSSHRRIPLWALLAKDELEWIKQYWSVRSGDAFTANGLLFSGASDPHVPLDSSWLFDPITRAFGRIVGDVGPQFRFHCLRHSFANWTLIKLVVADHPDWIAHMPTDCVMDPAVYAKKAQELKMAAFPKLPEMQEAPSRRYLYLVSALLGHLSPNTTVRHYISLLGWLARLELNSALSCRLKHWTHAELAHACGLSLSATTKAPYRGLCDIPLDFFGKFAAVHIPQSRHSAPALPSNLVDLSAAFTREFAPRVHSPSQLLVLLNLRIRLQEQLQYLQDSNLMSVTREAILTKMGQRHGVAPQSLEQAYAAYQKMYSSRGQKVLKPRRGREYPAIPSHSDEVADFWRILDQTQSSWSDVLKRPDMVLAATQWRDRGGYTTSDLGLGDQVGKLASIARGLISCGICADQLCLEEYLDEKPVLKLGKRAATGQALTHTLSEIRSLGIGIRQMPSAQAPRSRQSQKLVLRIGHFSDKQQTTGNRSRSDASGRSATAGLGVVRGLNYAAVWVLFAGGYGKTG